MIVEFAVARERGLDLALEPALRLRVRQPLMALDRIGIGLFARNAEEMADHLGGLAHVELGDRIGQPALKANDRLEVGGTRFRDRRDLGEDSLGACKACEPAHALLRPHQRRVAQRFRATRQNQIGVAVANVAVGGVDRLHARTAVDLHREGDHGFAEAEP